jgi:hypothetical protein
VGEVLCYRSGRILRFYCQHRGDICSKRPHSVYLATGTASSLRCGKNTAAGSSVTCYSRRTNVFGGASNRSPKEGFGSLTSHEENRFLFSRRLTSRPWQGRHCDGCYEQMSPLCSKVKAQCISGAGTVLKQTLLVTAQSITISVINSNLLVTAHIIVSCFFIV